MAASARNTAVMAALAALATLAGLVAYALLSHWLMVNAAQEPWAVALLFGPLVLAVAATSLQRRQWWLLAVCAAGVLLIAWVVAQGGVVDAQLMYVLQYSGIHLALAWVFGSSLRRGSTPLITAMARTVHVDFPLKLQVYTRWLTGMWTVYFLSMIVLSALVYGLAPWPWWSLFANVLTPAALAVVFLVEHVMRYRRHPDFERVSIRNAVRAYRQLVADPGVPPA